MKVKWTRRVPKTAGRWLAIVEGNEVGPEVVETVIGEFGIPNGVSVYLWNGLLETEDVLLWGPSVDVVAPGWQEKLVKIEADNAVR